MLEVEDRYPILVVEYTKQGYRVCAISDDDPVLLVPVEVKKYYIHPTSAYAAMGRLQHKAHIKVLGMDDPAKAPTKKTEEVR